MGETLFESARFRLSDTPAQYERAAPTFGRDNEYVLREILGYSYDRIAALRESAALA